MKETKKQYYAQIKRRAFDNWENAVYRATVNHPKRKKFADTEDFARKCIDKCIEEYSPKHSGEVTTNYCGSIGISSTLDESTRRNLEVVESRIRVREVTDWEDVE